MKLIIQITLLLFFSIAVRAQHPKIIKSRSLMDAGKTERAVAYLNKAYSKSGDKELAFELMRIHFNARDYSKAMKFAQRLELDKSAEDEDAILYIDLLMASGEYSRALDHCLVFMMDQEDPGESFVNRAYACEHLIAAEKHAIKYRLAEVPFNSWADEISITNYRRHYVMSSNRATETASVKAGIGPFNLFMLHQDMGKWRYPYYLLIERKTTVNRTSLTYSEDGNQVFYTVSDGSGTIPDQKDQAPYPIFEIYQATSMGNQWRSTSPLPFMVSGFSYKDPALHPDGSLLVFSSNVSGSGGFDLFVMEWKDESWSEPVSLGTDINTSYEETMAYFGEDGTLYFSSSNPLGFGGYDIYKTRKEHGIWLKPEILPPPINSPYDDLSYTQHLGRKGGYFVSNRPGGKGGYDIYEFIELDYNMGITVLDASNGTLLELAEVRISRDGIGLDQRLTNSDGLAEFAVGKDAVYKATVKMEGYLDGEVLVPTTSIIEGSVLYANVMLQPDPTFAPVSNDEDRSYNNQNFIRFKAMVTNASNVALAGIQVKLINKTSNRMKLVKTDDNGSFSQSLYLGNEYAFIFEFSGRQIEKVFSTQELNSIDPVEITYILSED